MTRQGIAYGLLALEIVVILTLAYMRFILNTLPLIPGVNSGAGALLGQQT